MGGGRGSKLNDEVDEYSVFSPTNSPQSTKFYLFEPSSMTLEENIVHCPKVCMFKKLFMSLYLYIILMFTLITLSFLCSPHFTVSCILNPGVVYLNWDLSFISFSHIKIAYFYLKFNVLLRTVCKRKKWKQPAVIIVSELSCAKH